jgi:hypothetical protein
VLLLPVSPFTPTAQTTLNCLGALVLAPLAVIASAVSASAQPAGAIPQAEVLERKHLAVEQFEPEQIEIEAGNDAVLLLRGSSLHELTEARVIRGGAEAAGVVGTLATVESVSATTRVLRITTKIDAPPGRYRIQLRAGRGVVASFARFHLTITEPDLSPKIVEALFDQPLVEHRPIRVRVRTACAGGLALVRASMGDQTIEARPLPHDESIAELELTARGVGHQTVVLVAVDGAGRTSEPMIRTMEILAAISDLSITDVRFNPEVVHADESIGAFVTVANTGTTEALLEPGSVLLKWTIDGGSERDFTVRSENTIAAGHERIYGPLIFEVDHAGDHPIGITLDPANVVAESNESNNDWARAVSVGPRRYPDLAIVAVAFDPPNPSPASPFRAIVRVMNQGTFTATIFPPDRILTAEGFSELRAGPQALTLAPAQVAELEMHPLAETIASGRKQWRFSIDPDNYVTESVENNNSYSASVTPGANEASLPDLVIDRATVRPSEPAAGESMFIVLGIRNVGTSEVLAPAGYTFYEIGGPMGRVTPIVTQMAERIPPGKVLGMRTVDFSIDEAGTHEISIQVDPNDATVESRKDNNYTTMTVVVN